MGVYIKGMEMPKSCDECILNNGITCYAVPDYKEDGVVGRTDDRPDWCPLVTVPPHGRLIDADALMGVIRAHDYPLRAHFNSTDNGMFTIGIQQAVDEAPTVIPASFENPTKNARYSQDNPAEEGE